MRFASWYGAVVRVVGGAALAAKIVAIVSCGSSSDTASGFAGDDGGTGHDGSVADAGGADGGASDAGLGVSVLVAVHASPDYEDVRLCFGESSTPDATAVTFVPGVAPWPSDDAHPMPRSNYAGIAKGGGATVPSEIVGSGSYVVPYIVRASRLATDAMPTLECGLRVGPQCSSTAHCLASTDYVQLPAIPWSSLARGGAQVLAIVGCKTPGQPSCGTAQNGALHAALVPLAIGAVQSVDQIGVQVAHVAPALGSITARVDGVIDDAGAMSLAYLHAAPGNGTVVTIPSTRDSLAWGTQGISIGTPGDGGLTLTTSLADIQRVSNPSVLPSDFFVGAHRYVFVLVGDPSVQNQLYVDGGLNPQFDGTGLHVVAISTAPAPPPDGG